MTGPVPVRLWRIAGALAIAHVALLFGGSPTTPLLGSTKADVVAAYVTGSMAGPFAGGYVEYVGFLAFLVGAVLVARLLRGRTETSAWLADCISGTAITYVAVTIAACFAAGAAALYDGHHGAGLSTITTVNDVRNFGHFLATGVLGVFTLAVAAAARASGLLPRWLAWSGFVVGIALLGSVPAARLGAVDYASLVWVVWFVALGVVALRGPRPAVVTRQRDTQPAGF